MKKLLNLIKRVLIPIFASLSVVGLIASVASLADSRANTLDCLCVMFISILLLLGLEYLEDINTIKHYFWMIRKILDSFINRIKGLSELSKATVILSCLLITCLLKLPYGFYTLIRLYTSVIAGCWGYKFLELNKLVLTITSVTVLILFQPLVPISLDKFTWNFVDVILSLCLFLLVWKFDVTKKS